MEINLRKSQTNDWQTFSRCHRAIINYCYFVVVVVIIRVFEYMQYVGKSIHVIFPFLYYCRERVK